MSKDKYLINLITDYRTWINLYDSITLIDPIKKTIEAQLGDDTLILGCGQACYEGHGKSLPCENCTSMRAINTLSNHTKLEVNNDKTYLVISIPIPKGEDSLVLELIKDVSGDGLINQPSKFSNPIPFDSNIKDELTQFYNYNFLSERLPYDTYKALWENKSLFLMIFEIVSKANPSSYSGRNVSLDKPVLSLAKALRQSIRDNGDWIARHKPSALVLVLHDIDLEQVERIKNRVIDKLNSLPSKELDDDTLIKIGIKKVNEHFEGVIKDLPLEEYISWSKDTKHMISTFDNLSCFKISNLTEREAEVAKLIIEGATNDQIASILYVGLSTVKKHVSSILQKTDSSSRAEFVKKCIRSI